VVRRRSPEGEFGRKKGEVGMWIYMNNAFLSIVQNDSVPVILLVRARRSGDVESVFPDAGVIETSGSYYAFRPSISREVVIDRIANAVLSIDYPNFKDSVSNAWSRGIYSSVWNKTLEGFDTGMYSRRRSRVNNNRKENSASRSSMATKEKSADSTTSFLPKSASPTDDRDVIDLKGEDLSKVDFVDKRSADNNTIK